MGTQRRQRFDLAGGADALLAVARSGAPASRTDRGNDMNARLRLLAWQIDLAAYEQDRERLFPGRFTGHEAKREGSGLQNRDERVRFSPWPALARHIRALVAPHK